MPITIDVLIVGQGLAGSLLVNALDAQGVRSLVLDPDATQAASLAAAGMLNPCTGPRYSTPEPLLDWLQPALATWTALGEQLGAPLIRELPLVRLFRDSDEAALVRQCRAADPAIADVLGAPRPGTPAGLADAPGHVWQTAWQVDLPACLARTRQRLIRDGRLIAAALPTQQPLPIANRQQLLALDLGGTRVQARAIVLCLGGGAPALAELHDLPWRLSRGEAVYLKAAAKYPAHGVSRRQALVPLRDGRYWLGANYLRVGRCDVQTDGDASADAATRLSMLLAQPTVPHVVERRSGIRPGSRTNQPFCAPLPNQPGVYLFNGLGSRGSLLGPRCAAALAAHLAHGAPLAPAWNPWQVAC